MFLPILTTIVIVLLVIVAAIQPRRSAISLHELKRRADQGNSRAIESLRIDGHYSGLVSILRVKVAFLLVLAAFLLVATLGLTWGIVWSAVLVLEYGAIARISLITKLADKIYTKLQPYLIKAVEKLPVVMALVRSRTEEVPDYNLGSIEELRYLVDKSDDILSANQKRLVVHSLSFSDKLVKSVMTPVTQIDSIKKSEFLGPLTLDELHTTGHSRLPVIAQDVDHVVGILNVQSLLALDVKRSVTAETAMNTHVVYLRHDQTLPQALAAFLRTHQHLFIVVDESRKTVGLVTLNDVIEALIGRKIVDDFDGHESLRAVAARNLHEKIEAKHEDS